MHPSELLDLELQSLEQFLVCQILSKELSAKFLDGKLSKHELAPYAREIKWFSEQYLTQQGAISKLKPIQAQAYALYYLPINFAKIISVFSKIQIAPHSLLDFGSGPGTATLAALRAFPSLKECELIESDAAMRGLAERLLAARRAEQPELKQRVKLRVEQHLSERKFDLVIAANALNELTEKERTKLLDLLISALSEGGVLMLLEPALKQTTRSLMRSRDVLLNRYSELDPLFPCTHRNPCPMLKIEDEWCHDTLYWREPKLVKQLDQITGFNKHRTKYSVCVFQLTAVTNVKKDSNLVRIVSQPKKTRRGLELLECSSTGLRVNIVDKKLKLNNFDLSV